ncbi:hypothetical protein HY383_04155 [Candidatus Daviesbacteria bacterium]|nr:hypothetical protein [Candidatus Daviesbacteria bacterium]
MNTVQPANFRDLIYQNLLGLATEDGINASGKDEIYGCIFGRDSALTILKILKVHKKFPCSELLNISKKALITLCSLQGKEKNIESGEQPGKFIHEFRKSKHEHLTTKSYKPWYLYPDGYLRNYDSLDSTPLALLAIYRYWEATADQQFLKAVQPFVEMGLNWIITYGDRDKDGLLDYTLEEERRYGGLVVQSWTDSHESLKGPDGFFPKYPIAPVEVQGKAWLVLKLWSRFYQDIFPTFAHRLSAQADHIKENFNKLFIFKDHGFDFAGQAIDGDKRLIKTITGNPLISLWAADIKGSKVESIIDDEFIEGMVKRVFQPDLFDADAGIRTMSTLSPTFNHNRDSYHNGSFWPMLNGLIFEGLENFGFDDEASKLKEASLKPLYHFNYPIELYIKDECGNLREYLSSSGQVGCRVQAWSAAAALDFLT